MGIVPHVHDWSATNSGYQCLLCSATISNDDVGSLAVPNGIRGLEDAINYTHKKKGRS